MTTAEVVIVTGAASGIGAACAERLTRQGHRVIGVDKAMPELSPHALAGVLALDITDAGAIEKSFGSIERDYGPIRSLVHCAGIMADGTATDTTIEAFERVLRVNLTGAFIVIRQAVSHMLANGGGSIVALGSTAGVSAPRRNCAYAVAKSGLHMLVRSVAVDFGPRGVRINAIAPGPTETPMFAADLKRFDDPSAELRDIVDATLDGRLATAAEVAGLVEFLLSERAAHMHGQVVVLDGGMLHGRT